MQMGQARRLWKGQATGAVLNAVFPVAYGRPGVMRLARRGKEAQRFAAQAEVAALIAEERAERFCLQVLLAGKHPLLR